MGANNKENLPPSAHKQRHKSVDAKNFEKIKQELKQNESMLFSDNKEIMASFAESANFGDIEESTSSLSVKD